jgi:hypothetical protein
VLEPGDIILTGINAQALVSRFIKLGSILRYGPRRIAVVAFFCFALPLVGVPVLAWILGLSFFGVLLAALLVGLAFGLMLAALWTALAGRTKAVHAIEHVRYSHSALVVDVDSNGVAVIQEAVAKGVVRREMHYELGNYVIVKTSRMLRGEDLVQVQKFAQAVLNAKTKYGIVVFAGLTVYCLTAPWPFVPTINIQQSGTAICSGFCCDAGTRWGCMPTTGAWIREPYMMMPADISFQARTENVEIIPT